ncbi:autotransporter outer membrane beta-barrel domain-containing protein [Bartonella rattimassiliensis]|uniref:Outer membrane autotransporter barrel domain-containing protein n=1 Tax=Bartonella rattimassiliensis 15908 TaxID=1094556 RepID=J0QPQ6_9HYPH|nr:autotransporter outer membrane beta-barrel domain-containing protein [Bartonella rattimassiliensis]EJF84989.1 outer membrane autotransporter barrel domain-containing protein [Bartonella rattimassiliensis 15908]
MCKKYIYKKNFLLCTIAGTLIFSHFGSTYANTQPPEIINEFKLDKEKEQKTLNNVFIRNKQIGVSATEKAIATITNSTIHTESTAFSVSKGGQIHAKGIDANSIYKGLETKNGIINIEDSIITVQTAGAGGIVLYETPKREKKEGESVINKISLTKSKLLVKDGVGIRGPYGSESVAEIFLKDSEIRADVLLRNKTKRRFYDDDMLPVSLTLIANNSILEGRARTLKVNTTSLTLNDNSKWYLKVSQEDVDTDFNTFNFDLSDLKQRALSTVSVLNLNNSSIIFNAPSTNGRSALGKGQYQILSVGRTAEVYKSRDNMVPTVETAYYATGDAKIYFNTEWSDGLETEQQKTDRLLVHGNVSGTTTIYVNNLSNNGKLEAEDSLPLNVRGLSLIQVSGEASETSFKLAKGYVTLAGLPYQYTLNAYGPTSSRGKAESTQNILGSISQESDENTLKDFASYVITGTTLEGVTKNEKNAQSENFWDFRLQNATLDNEGKIRALVPQVASYLVMPNAVFSTGFSDVSNQNTLLDDMRTTALKTENHKNKGLFLSSYGNKMTLSSNRTPLQYGYGADVHYAALQAGVILAELEEQNIAMNWGLLGTYGKLSFTPKDMEGADKSTLDKWSLAAYGDFHHNNGLYVNALFSYGTLKGNISTALIGKTAELTNADTFNTSATIGRKFKTNTKGLTFESQAQIIYQCLMLGILSDVDGFNVNMGNPHQWLVRIGGRLTQTTIPTEGNNIFSFYGKLNIIKAFSNNTTIQIGDTFHFDSMEAALESGLGVNAQLSHNIVFHADVNYQQKLQKAGISGINVSGGIRYRF